jgi:CRISPR-associated protein Cas5h
MNAIQLIIEGNWAHFKKPETSNNPLTHDFITKTAFIGLIGSVSGIERIEMRPLFPQLCEDLMYTVHIRNSVKKESWGFTMRRVANIMEKAPKYMELLKRPNYLVTVALKNHRSLEIFNVFKNMLIHEESIYTPVLGLHNCPANLYFQNECEMSDKHNGQFKTKNFVSKKHILNILETKTFHLGLDKIPTFQNNDFWNLPDRYVEVVYPSEGKEISVTGDYYTNDKGECMWMI